MTAQILQFRKLSLADEKAKEKELRARYDAQEKRACICHEEWHKQILKLAELNRQS